MLIEPQEEINKLTKGSQKKVKAKCDDCERIYLIIYRNYLKSQSSLNHNYDGKTFCNKCALIKSNKLRRIDKPTRYISNDGYVYVRIKQEKINGNGWSCYKKEHIVIAEQKIGRKLTKDEVVHHIDLDKTNNDPNNLFICSSAGHMLAHRSLESCGLELFKLGLISFDELTGKYMANVKLRELLEQLEVANQQPSLKSNF